MPKGKVIPLDRYRKPAPPDSIESYFQKKIDNIRESFRAIPARPDPVAKRLSAIEKNLSRMMALLENEAGGGQ